MPKPIPDFSSPTYKKSDPYNLLLPVLPKHSSHSLTLPVQPFLFTDSFKAMTEQCRNIIKKSTKHGVLVEPNKMVEYSEDHPFHISPTIRTNLFILSLFTRVSDHGILYSPRTNYRKGRSEFLLNREKFTTSLVDIAFTNDQQSIFCGNPIELLFFKEAELPDYNDDVLEPT